jgi:hypothetical protein
MKRFVRFAQSGVAVAAAGVLLFPGILKQIAYVFGWVAGWL